MFKVYTVGNTEGMTAMGFTSGQLCVDDEPLFTLDDLKASIFGTDRLFPRTILVHIGEGRPVHVAVDLVCSMPAKDTSWKGSTSDNTGLDWCIEGEIQETVRRDRIRRVRLLCTSSDTGSIEQVYAQLVQD